jgi:hypothetical protein
MMAPPSHVGRGRGLVDDLPASRTMRGETFAARRALSFPTFLVEMFDARGLRHAAPDALLVPTSGGGWRDPDNRALDGC